MGQNISKPASGKWTVFKGILRLHNKEIVNLKKSVSELESFKGVLIRLLDETDIKAEEK